MKLSKFATAHKCFSRVHKELDAECCEMLKTDRVGQLHKICINFNHELGTRMIISLAFMLGSLDPAICAYDKDAMFALSQDDFDQNDKEGWRKLAAAGCDEAAANLIRDWHTQKGASDTILFWHEGQLRASVGQYTEAIKLFELSKKTDAEDAGWGWNLYVDASIAYLKDDKPAFLHVRDKLANLPPPPSLATMVDIHGAPVEVEWPMNLNVLDAFTRCWGQSYKQAYACPPEIK